MDRHSPRHRLTGALILVVVLLAGTAEPAPEVYFSPAGGIQHRLLQAINQTRATIDLAVFDLTAGELAGALLTARARGVVVRVVADARQAQGKHSEIPMLLGRGVEVRLLPEPRRGLMHHKFAVFDSRLVVTGSYNWTESAERVNFENAVILDDAAVAHRFQAHFDQLFHGWPTRRLGSRS